jgi:hypothetical protein
VVGMSTDVPTGNADVVLLDPENPPIGAVYGMTPGSRFITTLAARECIGITPSSRRARRATFRWSCSTAMTR